MNNRKQVFAFDFDGTLTTKDTFIAFIRYTRGTLRFLCGFLLFSPLLVLMKLRVYPNYRAKQQVFSFFFRGTPIKRFDEQCVAFASHHRQLLRSRGISTLNDALTAGHRVLIVSASIDNWVRPFFPLSDTLTVIGTQIETSEGRITGRFLTPNCYGAEKVRRIKAVMGEEKDYQLTAFGDSRGDKEMLDYADKGYFKPFR